MILRKGKVEIGNSGLKALEASGAEEAVLILEVIHAFEADENQVLEEMQASVEFWKAAMKALRPGSTLVPSTG